MARQAKIDDISIPVFDGINFKSWKFRIQTLLEYKECDVQAKRARLASEEEASWKKKDLKAKAILISAVSDKQLEYISECNTTFDMMSRLESIYSTQSTSLQIIKRNRLENVKLKDFTTVEEFFAVFEKASNEFKAAGGELTEQEKLGYLIKALPENYSYIGDMIDLVPQASRTVEYVKSKIKEKDMKKTSNNENRSNVSTFNTKTTGCFECGKQGHVQRDCWRRPRGTQSRGYQQHTGRGSQGQRGSSQGFQGRGRGFRGRGRGNFTGSQHAAGSSREYAHELWATQVLKASGNKVRVNTAKNSEYESECVDRNEIEWLLDSGCTDHIINRDEHFCEYVDLRKPIGVKLPDGKTLKATKLGTVNVTFKNYYNEVKVELSNVYYVQGIQKNLLSVSKITERCTIVSREHNAKIYNKDRNLIAVANKIDGLYIMNSFVSKEKQIRNEIYTNSVKITEKEKWHRALGHVNFQYLSKLVNFKMVEGLPENLEKNDMKCANCIQSKMTNVRFENKRTKSKEILELIHTDLNGPHRTTGCGGEKYFLSFIDDYSKCTKIYCIKSKSETASRLIEFVNLVENKFNKCIKKLRCDNGREYLNKEIYEFAKNKGIEILPCPPYVHELNGVAERYNRSAMDMGRCLAREAKIHNRYWPEIMKTVAYLKNRTIANTQENKTPYELFFGIKPNVKHLKIYGSRVFVRIPEELRKSKWDDKAKVGVLVGYNETSYRVLVNNRIVNARHVNVIENDTELICSEKVLEDENLNECDDDQNTINFNTENESNEIKKGSDNESKSNESSDENEDVFDDIDSPPNESNKLRKRMSSARTKKPVQRFVNPIAHFIYVNYVNANVPNTFEEAISSKESNQWQKAMDNEMKSLIKNKTWKIVDKPKDKKIIDVKWVFKRKNDDTFKARLVVRGFQQKEHLENVYSPVGKMQTLRVLLSYCCAKNLFIDQMDVETAFLNGTVKSEVYIHEPKGYETSENKVCKLQKALYGLRESPRAWYECFNNYAKKLNFVRSNFDYCLYVNNAGKDPIYVLVFVDDLLICCKDKSIINEVKVSLMQRFCMKDLGKISNYIGINIDYNDDRKIMKLSQTKYIESLAAKYNLVNAKLYDTPMEANLKLEQSNEVDERIKYRNLIGELLYISTGTRPDITYSVNYLSRFQSCYSETHFKYALRVLKYLFKTKDLKLIYTDKNVNNVKLDCMVDSDYAGDNIDRKSTTGYLIRLYGNVIFWKTRKQNIVTKCSTFAEYTAMSEAVTEVLFLRNLLNETFDMNLDKPIKIYEDNSGAVAIAKFGNYTKNSKHIEVQYHYINENYENGIIDIVKINTDLNVADFLTKSLDKVKFAKNRKALNLT